MLIDSLTYEDDISAPAGGMVILSSRNYYKIIYESYGVMQNVIPDSSENTTEVQASLRLNILELFKTQNGFKTYNNADLYEGNLYQNSTSNNTFIVFSKSAPEVDFNDNFEFITICDITEVYDNTSYKCVLPGGGSSNSTGGSSQNSSLYDCENLDGLSEYQLIAAQDY